MDERVDKDMGGLAATLDFDAELMLRVKEGDGEALPFCSKNTVYR